MRTNCLAFQWASRWSKKNDVWQIEERENGAPKEDRLLSKESYLEVIVSSLSCGSGFALWRFPIFSLLCGSEAPIEAPIGFQTVPFIGRFPLHRLRSTLVCRLSMEPISLGVKYAQCVKYGLCVRYG